MKKTVWKKNGAITSKLGFGAMRLPLLADGEIDFDTARDMIDICMSSGVDYYDTAYVYHGGKSEVFLREALVKRYPRESYQIATKLPIGDLKTPEELTSVFAEQQERLGLETIDFYLLHCLNKENWENCKRLGGYEFISRLQEEGKIKYKGFSFHGDNADFKKIIHEADWDFVQLQINYLDWDEFAKEAYCYAEEVGLPVVVMEPLRGGALAKFPNDIADLFTKDDPSASKTDIAFRWLEDIPNVSVILSGMSTPEQCTGNISTFHAPKPLNESERDILTQVAIALKEKPTIPCTACLYCTSSCPQEIYIPNIFSAYNGWLLYEHYGSIEWHYNILTPKAHRADNCIKCGACIPKCPQGIDIPAALEKATDKIEKIRSSNV